MVLATPRNIKILTKAVKEIKAKGETYYSKALKLSFDLLEKSFQNDVQNSEVLRFFKTSSASSISNFYLLEMR